MFIVDYICILKFVYLFRSSVLTDNVEEMSSSNVSDDFASFSCKEPRDNLRNMLYYFNFMQKYPQKLTFRDALVIRHEIPMIKLQPADLLLVVMKKIMACDRKCRSLIIPCTIPKNQYYIHEIRDSEDTHANEDSDSEDENNEDDFCIVHPLDVIILLVHCSDNILRHQLFSKLFSCQLAVPLLLPDAIKNSVTLLLWALRSLKKTWKEVDGCGKLDSKNSSIVEHNGAVVSFLKCGKLLQKSKSKLLNEVIGSEDIFFHWDMLENQNCYKILSQGVVEICCYYPSKKDPIFKNAIIFTNLHGNASIHPKQVLFIQEISFISCVLIKKKDMKKKEYIDILQKLTASPGGLIVLIVDCKTYKEDEPRSIIQSKAVSLVGLKGKNSTVIREEIRRLISSKLVGQKFVPIAECTKIAHRLDIKVDEDDDDCVLGKQAAHAIRDIITTNKFTEIKSHFLRLQGPEMWQKWAEHNKEYHRHKERKNMLPMDYTLVKEQEKDNVRFMQLSQIDIRNVSLLIKKFLQILLEFKENCAHRSYFLQWLKMFLDGLSKDKLLDLQVEYQRIQSQLKTIPNTNNIEISELKQSLKVHNKMLINASVGTEHFFREIGQIYEAVHANYKPCKVEINFQNDEINILPIIAARTLIQGFPLEIMDGEASHVPLTWVQAITNCLHEIYPGKTLFILSILGVQSSGKSTLLNTMFGLQFNVSVGKCTRGAFIQLLPLDEELKNELHCDFIVIVDAEGICAPELLGEGFEEHDNELATFVIGLAHFTIINIYGETPANLNDILQTVMHAFIRMKEVDKNPGCLFVHQNVTEQFSIENLQPGKQIFFDQLNNLTQVVAKIEHCQTKYLKFQDVIEFDEKKDIYYFSSLWKGDPPMAPINPGYSESAQDLNIAILELIKSKKFCTFNSFGKRIDTLWTAILKENFIFSFKNTREVEAYRELELQYSECNWILRKVLEKQLLLCEKRIKSCGMYVSVETVKNQCINDSIKTLNKTFFDLCHTLTSFIENHDLGKVMSQWDFDTRNKLDERKGIFINTVQQQCERLVCRMENDRQKEELLHQYEVEISEHITKLVAQLGSNDTTDSEEVKKIFNANWNQWIDKFKAKFTYLKYPSYKDIELHIQSSITENLRSEYHIFLNKIKEIPLTESTESLLWMDVDNKIHIEIKRKLSSPLTWVKTERTSAISKMSITAQNETNCILDKMKGIIQSITTTKSEGVTSDLPDIFLKQLLKEIANFNKTSNDFSFTSEYKVDIALIVCRYAIKQFKKWTDDLIKQTDPILALQQQNLKFLKIFTTRYLEVTTETAAAANQFSNYLITSIASEIVSKLHIIIVSHLKSNEKSFKSKIGFKIKVLTDLAEKESFAAYKLYLLHSNLCLQEFALNHVLTKYFTNPDNTESLPYEEFAVQETNQLLFTVTESITKADISNGNEWLNSFFSAIDGIIEIKSYDWNDNVKSVCKDPDSIHYFKTVLIKELNSPDSHKAIRLKVQDECALICEAASLLLYESIIDNTCRAPCPFCGEQCDITNSDHLQHIPPKLHQVQVHRPQCLGKVKWHDSNNLMLDVCNQLVNSKYDLLSTSQDSSEVKRTPYKVYQQHSKESENWDIPDEKIANPPIYWMWFVSHFYRDLCKWLGASATNIPSQWRTISKSKAINSLTKTYGLSPS